MLKKIISYALAVLIVISCSTVAFSASTDKGASFSIGSAKSQAGGTVEIPIEIKNNPGITSFRLIVEYDSAILKLTNVSFKEASQGFNTGTSQTYDSPYSISGYNSSIDLNNNGQIVILTFEINQYAEEGRYDISLSYDEDDVFNMAGNNVTFAINNGFVEVIPCQHTGGEWEYLEEGNCTTKGIMIKKCEICGNEYERKTVAAKGHNFNDWIIEKQATCTEIGTKTRVCSVCTYEETEIINALGHNYPNEYTVDKAATCTENGEKSKHCTRCDSKTDITVINATGHSFCEWEIVKDATDKIEGLKERVCSSCGEKETEIIPVIIDKPKTKIGDVNGDGKIKIVDAKWILQSVAGTRTLNDIQKTAADVNKDGKVTIVDARWILQIVAGLRDETTLKLK